MYISIQLETIAKEIFTFQQNRKTRAMVKEAHQDLDRCGVKERRFDLAKCKVIRTFDNFSKLKLRFLLFFIRVYNKVYFVFGLFSFVLLCFIRSHRISPTNRIENVLFCLLNHTHALSFILCKIPVNTFELVAPYKLCSTRHNVS